MAALVNDDWNSAVIDVGYVSSTTLPVKFKFSSVKVCVIVEFGPTEAEVEERGT